MAVPFDMLIAAAGLALFACLLIGAVISALVERRGDPWTGAPYALALMLIVGAVSTGYGARGSTIAYLIVALVTVAVVVLLGWRRRRHFGTEADSPEGSREPPTMTSWGGMLVPAGAALAAGVLAALPFIVNWQVGILGVGLVNDDMAAHLLLADWIDERFLPLPILIDQGYPLGPHAFVAGLAKLSDSNSVAGFAALTLLIPALTAGHVAARLADRAALVRVAVAVPVAIAYLAAAYLAQGAFKEPMLALFVLAFALALPRPGAALTPPAAVGLGLLVAGALYVYSFPALAWLLGTAAVWMVICVLTKSDRRFEFASVFPVVVAGIATALALALPEIDRMIDFTNFQALDPSRANEGGLGNLAGGISPLEALGIWPSSEFRLPAGAGGVPAVAFYLGGLLGAFVLAAGVPRWWRRYGAPVPAALIAAVVVYLGALAFGTVYTSAKALAILAPLVMLAGFGGLLAGAPLAIESGRSALARFARPLRLMAAGAFAVLALASSFLVLRQAVVGPVDHPAELAELRPLVAGQDVLFLGRDNFVLWNLRGSRPFTHVRNYYNPYFVKPDTEVERAGFKFDVDALRPEDLAGFPFIITTRASYASAPPPEYRPVRVTDSYVLWGLAEGSRDDQIASIATRKRAESGAYPFEGPAEYCRFPVLPAEIESSGNGPATATAVDPRLFNRSTDGAGQAIAAGPPALSSEDLWTARTIENGETAEISLELPAGRWRLSIQYDATRPVEITTPSFTETLPANLDYRGVAPFWSTGEGIVDMAEAGGTVTITAAVQEPPGIGRLLGTKSLAHLGHVAATAVGPTYIGGLMPPFPGDGTRLVPNGSACSAVDWSG